MERFAQVGIALSALGVVLAMMGLFPGVTGVEPTVGIGIVQVILLLMGYFLLMSGALLYVKCMFYLHQSVNLAQSVGMRLAITGLLFAGLSGFADLFGFGSHIRTLESDVFFGSWQAFGLIASFAISSLGVMLYALAGQPQLPHESSDGS
jgi:hypothetical protein